MATTTSHAHDTMGTAAGPLLHTLGDNWWWLLLRGIAAVAFGVIAFVWPSIALLSLVLMWGIYALFDGAFSLGAALFGGGIMDTASRWWLAIVGVAGIAAGVVAFAWPGITAQVLLLIIAFWAIVVGVLEILGAIELRKEIEGEWLLALSGVLAIVFGAILLLQPAAGALSVVWLIATFAILYGLTEIGLAFRVKPFGSHSN